MKEGIVHAGCCLIVAMASASLLTAPGCSKRTDQDHASSLACLTFPVSSLPKNVSLAPWNGSDKLPWMTSNPFLSGDKQVISAIEEDMPGATGGITEVYLAAYWLGEAGQSPVEITLMALRFKDTAAASRAARAMQPQLDEHARVEPHSAPTLISQGDVVCIPGHTSAVDKNVRSARVRLVESTLQRMP